MNKFKNILLIILTSILFYQVSTNSIKISDLKVDLDKYTRIVPANSFTDEKCIVSIIELIANKNKYHNKNVVFLSYLSYDAPENRYSAHLTQDFGWDIYMGNNIKIIIREGYGDAEVSPAGGLFRADGVFKVEECGEGVCGYLYVSKVCIRNGKRNVSIKNYSEGFNCFEK